MGIKSYPGGVIRKTPVTPAGPYQDGAASGVWTLELAAYWNKQGLWPIAGNLAPTGLFGGGDSGSNSNVIDKINIAVAGNATDFGDLNLSGRGVSGASSSTRGLFAGFYTSASQNNIDYVSFASAGNATDFGDLSTVRSYTASCSNHVRACFMGGLTTVASSTIDYVTIASAGNATDFGDLVRPATGGNPGASYGGAAAGSSTRGLYSGAYEAALNIQYITIASMGNATNFGDIVSPGGNAEIYRGAAASETRALWAGGYNNTTQINIIDYVTIATLGNSSDFGDLAEVLQSLAGCSSSTRGVFGGGSITGSYKNTINYVTIASI